MISARQRLTPFAHSAPNRCFGCGPRIQRGCALNFCWPETASSSAFPSFRETFEGHPGYLHGGIIATLLDEAMSKAVRAGGRLRYDAQDGSGIPPPRSQRSPAAS